MRKDLGMASARWNPTRYVSASQCNQPYLPHLCSCLEIIFNAMLRDFGVTGVKVQEVFTFDDDFFASLK
jgi:hypothetical protein